MQLRFKANPSSVFKLLATCVVITALFLTSGYFYRSRSRADDLHARLNELEDAVGRQHSQGTKTVFIESSTRNPDSNQEVHENDGEEPTASKQHEAAHVDMDESDRKALSEQHADEVAEKIQTHFESEGRDSLWSDDAEASLDEAFNSVDLQGTDVIDIECRSTICRVEVDWQDRASQSRFFDQTADTDPFKTAGSARIYKDEYGEVVGGTIYLAKKGESIPR